MNLNFFKQTRILDGGMGQELLTRGVEPNKTLWSANALLNKKFHRHVINAHLDYIRAGAEVIVTTTFTTRRLRLKENGIEEKFEELNLIACELANKAKELSKKNILIAGGLPPQNYTYKEDDRNDKEISNDFYRQAKILNSFVDFFYFDVLSSAREFKLGIDSIKEFDKPYLIGIHISEGTKLPSGESISNVMNSIKKEKLLGVILGCISPENYLLNVEELKKSGFPFGFKINGFKKTMSNYSEKYEESSGNPNEFLGKREDFTPEKVFQFSKKIKDMGATILGGCCETNPAHISKIAILK